MKNFFLAALVVSAAASAQSTKTFKVSNYDEIAVAGPYSVELVKGEEGTITATGDQDDLDNLIVETEGDKLVIKKQKRSFDSPKNVKIKVPIQEISEVALSGSGHITNDFALKADKFEAALSGSGAIVLQIEAREIDAAVSGSGRIELKGNSESLESSLSGSGRIAAYDLKATQVKAAVSGSGQTQVNCTDDLSARVSGSGSVSYKGNPKKEDIKVTGSGKVVKS